MRDEQGRRPIHGDDPRGFHNARGDLLFYEYFDGDSGRGLGASHQTGWTALVAKLIAQSGDLVEGAESEGHDTRPPAALQAAWEQVGRR